MYIVYRTSMTAGIIPVIIWFDSYYLWWMSNTFCVYQNNSYYEELLNKYLMKR